MAFLRRGFLKSANRPNELYCRIDPAPFAALVFAMFFLFLADFRHPHAQHRWPFERVVARHAKNLPEANREDAIWIILARDGHIYFRNTRILPVDLPNRIRDSVLNGAEKRIYLQVDAREQYRDVNAVLQQIQIAGIEKVSILTESPYFSSF